MTSIGPNAVLPCGTDSARRRHLARGDRCPACVTGPPAVTVCARCGVDGRLTVAAYVTDLEVKLNQACNQIARAEAKLAKLGLRVEALSDWAALSARSDALAAENEALRARLDEVQAGRAA